MSTAHAFLYSLPLTTPLTALLRRGLSAHRRAAAEPGRNRNESRKAYAALYLFEAATRLLRRRSVEFSIALLPLFAPMSAVAQTSDESTIHGRVTDQQGALLPGVTVTASSPAAPADTAAPATLSDGEGNYQLKLSPGRTYTVSGELSGFSTFVRSGVEAGAGQAITLDIQLQVGSFSESITVLGDEVTRSRVSVERVQDVPLSISIVSGKELERLEATDISALTQRTSNVSWNFGNQRTSSLSIRGIGKQGQTEAQDPSVGVIVDGVNYAYNALTSSYDFTDVDTLEVTRGPQGTLLGKNTSLGVVNVITKRPVFTQSADAGLTLGAWGTALGRLAIGGAVTEKIAWRGTFSFSKGGGDIRNLYNPDITYTNKDRVSGRVQFLFAPSPRFSARIAVNLQPRGGETTNGRTIFTRTPAVYSNGSPTNLSTDASTRLARRWFTQQGAYTFEGNYLNGDLNAVDNDIVRPLVTGSKGASAELNWFFGRHTVTSISAYQDYHFNAVNDDGTPFDVYRNAGGFWNDYQQVSQELRLSSRISQLIDYQAGLFLIDVVNDVDYQRRWGNDAGAWFASPAQYGRLDADSAGRYLMQQSLDRVSMSFNSPSGVQHIRNRSGAPFAQANWHLFPKLTLTTGVRFTWENRRNRASTIVRDYGNAPELNPAAVNGVQLGGFNSNSAGVLAAANSADQLSVADRAAEKYFGVAATAIAGGAYNSLTAAQKQQIADARAIRASQIGVVFNPADAEAFKDVQPSFVVSPSYKITNNLTTYVSWQYGEKAGIAQFTNGISNLASGEKSSAYEWGLKTVLFDRRVVLNTALFLTDIRNYQQSVRALDVYTTALNNDGLLYYTSATGNVPKVRAKGVEVDGVFAGLANLNVRFSGAYNDARYKYFPNSAQPVENGFTGAPPYRDVSGQALPGSSRWSFNIAPEYRIGISGDGEKELHFSFNTAFSSRYKSDNLLSDYSWIPGRSVTDLSVGYGRSDQRFDISFLVKNAFNDRTPQTQTWNSYTPAVPRWYGVQFTTRLY